MFRVCAFADEISAELDEQLDILKSEGISYIELRGVWGKNVLDFTDDDLLQIKQKISEYGIGIAVIGSPIGKVNITDDFDSHLDRFMTAVKTAHYFDAKMVRIFSFFIPKQDNPAIHRDEVMRRLNIMASIAEKEDILLVHENESNIYGDTAERNLDIIESIGSESLMACFDPANYICEDEIPFPDAYNMVSKYIKHVHIKDAVKENGIFQVKPAGEGNGKIEEILKDLKNRKYVGFISLEPHFAYAGQMYGYSGPDQFKRASTALKDLIDNI